MSRAEMAARVAELRAQGLLQREVAERLGISRTWAAELDRDPEGKDMAERRKRYRGTCLDCGRATDGSNGRAKAPDYCRHCAPKHSPHAKWTAENIVEAIQRWTEKYGSPPSAMDWNPAMARAADATDIDRIEMRWERGDWPTVTSVIYHCGSWSGAIAAAGFKARRTGQRQRGDRSNRMAA